jgi:hypothetical protein
LINIMTSRTSLSTCTLTTVHAPYDIKHQKIERDMDTDTNVDTDMDMDMGKINYAEMPECRTFWHSVSPVSE